MEQQFVQYLVNLKSLTCLPVSCRTFSLSNLPTMPFSKPRLLHACFCLFIAPCRFTPTLISLRHLQVLCVSAGRSVGGSAAETLMVSLGLAGTFPAPPSTVRVPEMEDGATCLQADGTFEGLNCLVEDQTHLLNSCAPLP